MANRNAIATSNLQRRLGPVGVATVIAVIPSVAHAGMPSIKFHDVAAMRLQTISLFLLGFLLSAAAVWWIGNYLRRDFASLPRLSFSRACGGVALWGLLFVVVLTMISGARELMTPGAWERNGRTYQLAAAVAEAHPATTSALTQRKARLRRLYGTLVEFAAAHDGRFPSAEEIDDVAGDRLLVAPESRMRLIYVPDRDVAGEPSLLAYEPTLFGADSLALFTSGEIRQAPFHDILALRNQDAADGDET